MISDIINSMDRKIVIGAILAFVVISVIVFVMYQQQEDYVQEEDFGPEEEADIHDGTYYEPVEQGSILDECGSQETQYKRDMCWKFEAFDYLDPERCLNIEENSDKIICLRTIARDTEGKGAMLAVCNQYLADDAFQKYRCHSEVAKELIDYTICDAMPLEHQGICFNLVDAENPYPETRDWVDS